MSDLATMLRRVTRYLGFSLVMLGAAGLSVGYMGWKDAASRAVATTDPAGNGAGKRVVVKTVKTTATAKPKAGATASNPPKLSPTQELLRTTSRPPVKTAAAAETRFPVTPVSAATPSVRLTAPNQ